MNWNFLKYVAGTIVGGIMSAAPVLAHDPIRQGAIVSVGAALMAALFGHAAGNTAGTNAAK